MSPSAASTSLPPSADARRILISGATGFVGANLVRRMLERGHEVHVIVRPDSAAWRIGEVIDEVQLHRFDLLDAEATRQGVTAARPQVVLHFAAHAALPQETDEMEIILHTVQPLVNLASACTGCELFINAGSSSEYGFQTEPMTETSLPNPTRVHDIAKLTQTLYAHLRGPFQRDTAGDLAAILRLWSMGARTPPDPSLDAIGSDGTADEIVLRPTCVAILSLSTMSCVLWSNSWSSP